MWMTSLMRLEQRLIDLPPRVSVCDFVMHGCRRQGCAVRGEHDGPDRVGVPSQNGVLARGGEVPEPDRLVRAGRGEDEAVG